MIGSSNHKTQLKNNMYSAYYQCMEKINDIRSNVINMVKNTSDKDDGTQKFNGIFDHIKDSHKLIKIQIKECKDIYKQSLQRALPDSIKGWFDNRAEYLAFQIHFLESALDMARLLMSFKSRNSVMADHLIEVIDNSQFIPDFYVNEENKTDEDKEYKTITAGQEESITGEGEEKPEVTEGKETPTEAKGGEKPEVTEGKETPTEAKGGEKPEVTEGKETPTEAKGEEKPEVTEGKETLTEAKGEEKPELVECKPETEVNEWSDIYICMEKINTVRENTIKHVDNISKIPNQTDMYQIAILNEEYSNAIHKQIQECNSLLNSNQESLIKPIKEYFPSTLEYLSFQVHYFETVATMGRHALALNAHSHPISDAVITFITDSNFIYELEH